MRGGGIVAKNRSRKTIPQSPTATAPFTQGGLTAKAFHSTTSGGGLFSLKLQLKKERVNLSLFLIQKNFNESFFFCT